MKDSVVRLVQLADIGELARLRDRVTCIVTLASNPEDVKRPVMEIVYLVTINGKRARFRLEVARIIDRALVSISRVSNR
jgi:hypothetical protein